MHYTVIKHSSHLRTLEKRRKHSPAAHVFYISLVFSNACRVLLQCNTRLRLLYLLIKVAIHRWKSSKYIVCNALESFSVGLGRDGHHWNWLMHKCWVHIFSSHVGELTFDVGESTSYIGELVVGEMSRWQNDRLPLWRSKTASDWNTQFKVPCINKVYILYLGLRKVKQETTAMHITSFCWTP